MDLPHVFNLAEQLLAAVRSGPQVPRFDESCDKPARRRLDDLERHQYRSSGLIQVQTPGNPLGPGELFSRVTKANLTGNPIRTGINRRISIRTIRTLAGSTTARIRLSPPLPPYTLGNASIYYSDFRNPPYLSENISIVKDFAVTESIRLQYRADAFNALNRTVFGNINGTVGNANFGRPGGVQIGPRAITMGLRLMF